MKSNLKNTFILSIIAFVVTVAVTLLMLGLQVLDAVANLNSSESASTIVTVPVIIVVVTAFLSGVICVITGVILIKRRIFKK